MKPAAFKYRRASCAEEAISLLQFLGEDARCLAGGQSLVPMMNFRIARPSALVDLNGCADLNYMTCDEDGLHIGAMTRQRDVELSALVREACPLVSTMLGHAGPVTIRQRATIGGSIANGYPLAEMVAAAICLDAIMIVEGTDGPQRLAPADFFLAAMSTNIEAGSLLREVVFPRRQAGTVYAFRRAGNHAGGATLAMVAASAMAEDDGILGGVSLVASGLDGVPLRLRFVEQAVADGASAHDLADAYRADLAAREAPDDNEHMRYVEDVSLSLMSDVVADLRAQAGLCA